MEYLTVNNLKLNIYGSNNNRNDIVSNSNLKTEVELKCVGKNYSTERYSFWQRAEHFGTDKLDSRFQHGNGYKVWAKDFPEGTILKVTAEIILPDE